MLVRSTPSLSDVYALMNRYNLAAIDWRDGTAEGFARHLLLRHNNVKDQVTLHLAVQDYLNLGPFPRQASAVERFRKRERANFEAAEQDSQARAWLLDVVRAAKFGINGHLVWPVIARLATCPPATRLKVVPELTEIAAFVDMALTHLKKALTAGFALSANAYSAGELPELDKLVRLDVDRLDSTLAAIADTQRSPEHSPELSALLALASDERFLEELRSFNPTAPSVA